MKHIIIYLFTSHRLSCSNFFEKLNLHFSDKYRNNNSRVLFHHGGAAVKNVNYVDLLESFRDKNNIQRQGEAMLLKSFKDPILSLVSFLIRVYFLFIPRKYFDK